MPAVRAVLQSVVLKHLKSVGGNKRMFNFCHSHIEWCQKGHSRSVVKSKWTINFKNNSDPSTPKLSWRQQPSKTTFQIHKPSFMPQEVTTKSMAFLSGRFQEEALRVQWLCYYMNHTEKSPERYTIPALSYGWKLRSDAEQIFGKKNILRFWKPNLSSDPPMLRQDNRWINTSLPHTPPPAPGRDLCVEYYINH